MFSTYDVPELKQPKINKLVKVYSNVNSSVNVLIPNKNAPTQKPTHIGQWKKPFNAFLPGRIKSNIDP